MTFLDFALHFGFASILTIILNKRWKLVILLGIVKELGDYLSYQRFSITDILFNALGIAFILTIRRTIKWAKEI